MRHLIAGLIILAVMLPGMAYGNYLLTLKNGEQMVTKLYWEEGNQIKFYRYGGVTGLNRDMIKKIEDTSMAPENAIVSDAILPETSQDGENADQAQGGNAKGQKQPNTLAAHRQTMPDLSASGVETADVPAAEVLVDDPYLLEFEMLKDKYETIRFEKDSALYAYARELTDFRDKILGERLGHVYSEQLVEIYSILARVETVVKEN